MPAEAVNSNQRPRVLIVGGGMGGIAAARALAQAPVASQGDYRDWGEIDRWAAGIAAELRP
jgi:cation diffusion facilitator CzcD-associated flavoprotein CzcO